jgi:dipeptidase
VTQGVDAGIFGDPTRYPPIKLSQDPTNGVALSSYRTGMGFQRQISLFNTAYSTISQSRSDIPNDIGAVTWIGIYESIYLLYLLYLILFNLFNIIFYYYY